MRCSWFMGVSWMKEDASTWGDFMLILCLHPASCRCGSRMQNKAVRVGHVVMTEDGFVKTRGFFMSSWMDVRGPCVVWSRGVVIWWWHGVRFGSTRRCHLVEARMTCGMHAGSCGVLFPSRGETAHPHALVRISFYGATSWRNSCRYLSESHGSKQVLGGIHLERYILYGLV